MNSIFKNYLCLCLVLPKISNAENSRALQPVHIDFIEALDSKDNDYSVRFKKEFELAILEGVKSNKANAEKCGYDFQFATRYFEKSDPLRAQEEASKAEKLGSWMIVAPARSSHYLLSVAGAPNTPSISILASSKEVFELEKHHLTLSHSNKELAKAAVAEVARRILKTKTRTFVSVVSSDCISCGDFASKFKSAAQKVGILESSFLQVSGEDPDVDATLQKIKAEKTLPSFILLPNYSMVSARVMAKLSATLPKQIFFVGSDGWGTSKFGFVQNAKGLEDVSGFSVRSFPPSDIAFPFFRTGKSLIATNRVKEFESTSALGVLSVLDSTTELLCKYKPVSAASFKMLFARNANRVFKAPWQPSLYNFESGNLSFARLAELADGATN